MIELADERLVPLRNVPKRPNGKRIHISAVYRWIKRGVHGVRLESTRIGGTTYTSHEALQRFSERLSDRDNQATATRTSSRRRQQHVDRATRQVEVILSIPPSK